MKKLLLTGLILTTCACTTSPPAPQYLKNINNEINSYVYIKDKTDHWASPKEFYAKGGGDCEDFAIAKAALVKQYLPSAQVDVALVRDVKTGEDHAVLLVDNMWILDNKIKSIYKLTSKTFTNNYDFYGTSRK